MKVLCRVGWLFSSPGPLRWQSDSHSLALRPEILLQKHVIADGHGSLQRYCKKGAIDTLEVIIKCFLCASR